MAGGYRIELLKRQAGAVKGGQRAQRSPNFDRPAAKVWSDEPILSLGDDGVILGYLFKRGPPSGRVERLDENELARLHASHGRSILSDYWGSYVMVRAEPDGHVTVLRDPSGGLPCYFRHDRDVVVISDDITKIASRSSTSVNYIEIARLLASADAPGRDTCVSGVTELIAGECIRIVRGAVGIEQWWSPWDHVRKLVSIGFSEAAEGLRELLLDTVGAWAECFDRILLGVSGGLDSSIVAAAASRSAADLVCLTLVGPDPEGDERRYARCLTDKLGLQLTEAFYSLAEIDVSRAPAPHHPWPNAGYFKQSIGVIHDRLQRELSIDAHFSGNGGDGIFFGSRSALPFIDRLLVEGPRWALTETLRDLSDLTGADARTVLGHAWARYRHDRGRHAVRFDMSGISDAFAAQVGKVGSRHPWLRIPDNALPGNTTHIAFLLRSHRSLELYPRASASPHVAPLLSQPIVEFCLSIPSWYWVMGGANRALARAAFTDILPETILRRSLKGGPGGFNLALYRENASVVEKLLREGRLAQAGLLDPSLLDRAADPSWRGTERIYRLLSLGSAEAWTRWWCDDCG